MSGARVLFLASEYPPFTYGGLGTHVYELTGALARRGVKLGLAVPAHAGYETPPAGIDLLEVPVTGAVSDGEFWLRFCHEAVVAAERSWGRPDVIHAHDWMTVLGGIRMREALRIPLMFSVHLPQLTEPNVSMESLGLLYADCVMVNSRAVAAELAERRLPIRALNVVPNGVDLGRFSAAAPVPRSGTILLVGRLVAQKGVDVALRALVAVLGRCPQARLVVAGDGDQALYLRRTARFLGIASHVGFVGWQTGDALVALYRQANVVVVPSRYEPFGLVALEAMACGRPVIASQVGGLTEVVVDAGTGYLVPPGDDLRLAQRVAQLLLDHDTATQLGTAARQRAESYGWDSIAARTERIYGQIAGADITSPLGRPGALVDDLLRSVTPASRTFAERLVTEPNR
jgi:glycosyltransferase involved in cell wall biosynthesis